MLQNGTFAVAVVQHQVRVVQATRSHTKREKFLEVTPYQPFGGEGVFLASSTPIPARIPLSDILTVLDVAPGQVDSFDSEMSSLSECDEGMVKLSGKLYEEYIRLSEKQVRKHERVWNAWVNRR